MRDDAPVSLDPAAAVVLEMKRHLGCTKIRECGMLNSNCFDNEKIGQKIKALRIGQKLSLNKLAGKAGIAVSFLSKIESGKSALSVASLLKVLEALNVHVIEFFQEKPEGNVSDTIVFKGDKMKTLRDIERNWRFAFPSHPDLKMALLHEEYSPKTKRLEREEHPGDMCGYVLEGTLELEIIGRGVFTAEAGDAFYVKSGVEHVSRNAGGTPLRMVVVMLKQ